jgi:Phosphate acetyl/butaryl transferase
MSSQRIQATLDQLLASRSDQSKKMRLAIAATLDTPVGELRSLLNSLASKDHYEIHLVGPDECIQPLDALATLHPAYLPNEIDATLGNLITSGGIDLGLLLPDPRRPEPSAAKRLTHAFKNATLTGISLLNPEFLNRPMLLSDTLISDQPNHDELESTIRQTMNVARKVGISMPRTAILAAVEVANPGLPVTMLELEVAERFIDDPDGYVQGPLSMDLAINEQAAIKKKAKGEVPGKADILVAPSLTVARGVLHALVFGSGIPAVSVLFGGQIPVAVGQRGVPLEENVLAVQFAELLR